MEPDCWDYEWETVIILAGEREMTIGELRKLDDWVMGRTGGSAPDIIDWLKTLPLRHTEWRQDGSNKSAMG